MLVNPIALFMMVIAALLLLAGPVMAVYDISLWGAPMLCGLILTVLACIMQSDTEKRNNN